jgi:hypothetical protein
VPLSSSLHLPAASIVIIWIMNRASRSHSYLSCSQYLGLQRSAKGYSLRQTAQLHRSTRYPRYISQEAI